jgi:hypothetical protein
MRLRARANYLSARDIDARRGLGPPALSLI